jgi:hypothetical protein
MLAVSMISSNKSSTDQSPVLPCQPSKPAQPSHLTEHVAIGWMSPPKVQHSSAERWDLHKSVRQSPREWINAVIMAVTSSFESCFVIICVYICIHIHIYMFISLLFSRSLSLSWFLSPCDAFHHIIMQQEGPHKIQPLLLDLAASRNLSQYTCLLNKLPSLG